VPLGEEIPLERGHQRWVPPLQIVILPLLAHLARKRLQIDTDVLLIARFKGEYNKSVIARFQGGI